MASRQFSQIDRINASPIRAAVYCQILLTLSCSLLARADNPVGPDAAAPPKMSADARNQIARAVVRNLEKKTVSASSTKEKMRRFSLKKFRYWIRLSVSRLKNCRLEKCAHFLIRPANLVRTQSQNQQLLTVLDMRKSTKAIIFLVLKNDAA